MKRRYGFTLLELLVVLALVAMLACIAIPAYQGTRQKASLVQCVSNLRQLSMAALTYAALHDNQLPPWNQGQSAGSTPDAKNAEPSWAQILLDNGCIEGKAKVFLCPEDVRGRQNESEISYAMNANVAAHRLSEIEFPSKLVLITERYNATYVRRLPSYAWAGLSSSAHMGSGHQGKAAFAFVDGHGEILPYTGDPYGHQLPGAATPPADRWQLAFVAPDP